MSQGDTKRVVFYRAALITAVNLLKRMDDNNMK